MSFRQAIQKYKVNAALTGISFLGLLVLAQAAILG
jgi:hypothetical protein